MSQKKPTTKFDEPIKLETTILKINVKTSGDLTTKEYDLIPFHSNMADIKDLSNNNYIFFPTFAKITMNDLKRAKIGSNYLKIFTTLDKYLKLVEYIASDDRETDNTLIVDQSQAKQYALSVLENITGDIVEDFVSVQKEENTEEGLTDEEIITNNIGLIKSIFFPRGGRFYVLKREYIIGKSKYIPPFVAGKDINQKLKEKHTVPLSYTITVDLELLDATNNPNAGDFGRLSCKAKKINIKNDLIDMFGTKFKFQEQKQKAVLPSLLQLSPEITERGYGKLQREWEERNKYVKPPETEAERLAIEKNWTPLQRKMSQLDKAQQDYNKIPQLWIKDRNDLDKKYEDFFISVDKYKKEIEEIKENNKKEDENEPDSSFVKELTQTVVDNMALAAKNLLVEVDKVQAFTLNTDDMKKMDFDKLELLSKSAPELKQLFQEKKDEYKKLNYAGINKNAGLDTDRLKDLALQMVLFKKLDDIIVKVEKDKDISKSDTNNFKELEIKIIDAKYVEPFLDDLKIKQKDVEYLTKEEKTLDDEIKKNGNDSKNIYKKSELAKLRAKLFKKQVEFRKLKEPLGENGKNLIEKWVKGLDKMKDIKNTVENEKNNEEKKVESESVNKELKSKFEEIEKAKKLLLTTSFFEGNNKEELTRSEKEKFGRQDAPIEKYEDVKSNVKNLEEEYLEISKKLGIEKEIQAKVKLLMGDVDRIKSVKDAKESERKKKDDELEGKDKSKKKILDNYFSNGKPIDGKPVPPQEQKRIDDLTAEQIPLRAQSNKLKITVDRVTKKKALYVTLIDELKRIKDEVTFRKKMDNFNEKIKVLTEYSENVKNLLTKEYTSADIEAEIDRLIKKEDEKLSTKLTEEQIAAKKKDPEYETKAKNKLDEKAKEKYVVTYNAAIEALDKVKLSGGGFSKRHYTRRHKRVKHKKTIRKNKKSTNKSKSKSKKSRTYKRRKMAKKTLGRYRR